MKTDHKQSLVPQQANGRRAVLKAGAALAGSDALVMPAWVGAQTD